MADFLDATWLWTLSPGFIRRLAKRRMVFADIYVPWRRLTEFYPARNVMYFLTDPTEAADVADAARFRRVVCSLQTPMIGQSVDDALRNTQALAAQSLRQPNMTGVIIDDFSSKCVKTGSAEGLSRVHAALHAQNPRLPLHVVIYAHNLDLDLSTFAPFFDRISFWVWDAADLPKLDAHLARCERAFPGKPVNLGIYLFDFGGTCEMVPLPTVQSGLAQAKRWWRQGRIEGVQLLGSYVGLELHTPEARWVASFLRGATEDGRPSGKP